MGGGGGGGGCFRVPGTISGELEVLDPGELANSSVAQSLVDFDLSLLDSGSASVSSSGAAPGVVAEALDDSRDSLQHRISDLEERVRVFQFEFRRVSPSVAVPMLVSACRAVLQLPVSEADFFVVRLLHRRKGGVLVRVRSLALMHEILAGRAILRTHGFFVDLS